MLLSFIFVFFKLLSLGYIILIFFKSIDISYVVIALFNGYKFK